MCLSDQQQSGFMHGVQRTATNHDGPSKCSRQADWKLVVTMVTRSCPPKKRRAKAHRALGDCDHMDEQTDFSTFSAKKAQKGRYSPKKRNIGRKKRALVKGYSTPVRDLSKTFTQLFGFRAIWRQSTWQLYRNATKKRFSPNRAWKCYVTA